MNLSLHETFFVVLGGLIATLAVTTGLGGALGKRTIDPETIARIAYLNARLRAAWSIVPVFAAAFLLGLPALAVVFAGASFFALREFVSLTPIKPSDHWALVIAFYVVIPVQYLLVGTDAYDVYAVFIPVYVFLVLPIVMAWRQNIEHYLERIAKVQWGLMICVFCVSHAPAIAALPIVADEARGALLLLFFLLVVQLSEIFVILASALVGRASLRSNPRKSRAGAALGGLAATLTGAALWWLTPFAWWQAGLMAALTFVSGLLGGLVLSLVKRSLGFRDWGEGIELSRGALERLDAIAFAAPVFFHASLYFFGPAR